MTLHDVNRLLRHWAHHPPLRMIVHGIAVVVGVKMPEPPLSPSEYTTGEELKRLVDMTNGGQILGTGRG